MAVPEQIPYVGYIANGITTEFPITFDLHDDRYLVVTLNKEKPSVGSYTVSNGKVLFLTPPENNAQVELYRSTTLDRDIDYKSYDNSFRPAAINFDFDKTWQVLQEQHMVDAQLLARVKEEVEWRRVNDNLLQHQINILNDVMYGVFNKASQEYLNDKLKAITDAIDIAAAAGAGENGWTDQLVQTWSGRSQQDKNKERVSVKDFGAIGDGTLHTLQEWIDSGKFSNLTAIQVVYPHATALTDTIDWIACQAAIDFVGKGGDVLFNQTAQNTYIINKPLKYYSGQHWVGCGGIDVLGLGTEIRLSTSATSVAEPKTPTVTTYGFNPIGIYFNAQNFGDAGLSLYNTSYANVDQCAANSGKAGGCGILLDSDVSKQCYFNKINMPRVFAGGVGGTGIRFTRGANANQVFGGKCGSSKSGMEFLSLSAGNVIIGTDFEDNAVKHVFIDAPGNVFIGTHMETAPIGYDITANGSETRRIATTFAATVTSYVQDNSGGITQTVVHESYSSGLAELVTGSSKQTTQYFTTSATQNNDFKLLLGTENLVINFFRNTNSTSASKRITFFKGDGTATESFRFDIATAEFQCGDIIQKSSTNIQRKMIRAAAIPSTGTYSEGDTVNRTNPTATAPVTQWTCVTGGTSGTWQASAWVVSKGATASRPTLTANDIGVQYFDTTLAAAGKPIWWTGSAWVDATGVAV